MERVKILLACEEGDLKFLESKLSVCKGFESIEKPFKPAPFEEEKLRETAYAIDGFDSEGRMISPFNYKHNIYEITLNGKTNFYWDVRKQLDEVFSQKIISFSGIRVV